MSAAGCGAGLMPAPTACPDGLEQCQTPAGAGAAWVWSRERASKQERRRETVRERGPPSLETKHIWAVEGCGCLAHRLLARLARRLLLGCALRHPPSLGLVLFHDLHDINHLQHASACTHVTATVTGTARARPPGSRLRASTAPARQRDGTDHTASRTSSRSSASTRDLDLRSTAMNYRPAR